MNDGQLQRHLSTQNPWWTRPDWELDDPSLRAVSRSPVSYEPDILRDIRPGGLYVVRGPRRVGKSVEVKRAISAAVAREVPRRAIIYCSCEGLSANDLRRLILSTHSRTRTVAGPRYWFLDEITAVKGWSAVVKNLRDTDAEFADACVVLAGSSARDLRDATSDLAGRRGLIADSDRLLLPMGFRDFARAVGRLSGLVPTASLRPQDVHSPEGEQAIWELEPFMAELDDVWQLFVEVGGFPQAVSEFAATGEVSDAFVRDLLDVIRGDIVRNTRLSELEALALLDRLTQNICSPINLTSVATDIGLRDNERADDRIRGLVENFLAWKCHRAAPDLTPHTRAQSKLYYIDPLIAALANRRNDAYRLPGPSQLNQQQIALLISRALTARDPSLFIEATRLLFERTPTDAEIDFVGPDLAKAPVEAKYVDTKWKREAQTMRARYGKGVLATRGVLDTDNDVWAVPSAILGWLLS